jgi:fermentation-respiration switch protein FrsA (DUF1100 family)
MTRKMSSLLLNSFLVSAGTYLVLLGYFIIFQSDFIYFPERKISLTPKDIKLTYQDIELQASDGTRLSAWFIPADHARGVILFCHGNAGNLSHRIESILLFHRLNLSTFIFDYRGYGKSQGKPSESGSYLDGEAAWNYLIDTLKVNPKEIILFGESLGGAVAAYLSQKYQPQALILNSTFTSLKDVGAKLYPYIPVRLIARFNYPTIAYLKKVHCPVLIVHSHNDEFVPLSSARKLFEAAHEPKEFLELKGSHNECTFLSAKAYEAGLKEFISRL